MTRAQRLAGILSELNGGFWAHARFYGWLLDPYVGSEDRIVAASTCARVHGSFVGGIVVTNRCVLTLIPELTAFTKSPRDPLIRMAKGRGGSGQVWRTLPDEIITVEAEPSYRPAEGVGEKLTSTDGIHRLTLHLRSGKAEIFDRVATARNLTLLKTAIDELLTN